MRCFGHQRELSESASQIYKPQELLDFKQLYHSSISTRQLTHSIRSFVFLLKETLKPPPKTQTLINNVVLSIPEGRDQADSGRMLVSSGRPSYPRVCTIPWLTLSRHTHLIFVSAFALVLNVVSSTTGAVPSAPPSPALKPVRALDNAPAQDARTGRPRR